MSNLSCVLFDLDGTLVDTAPDLIACLNTAIGSHGYPAVEVDRFKPFISYGAAAMIEHAAADASAVTKQQILDDMLSAYQRDIAVDSRLFEGLDELLSYVENRGLKWGIVTNKRQRFTFALLQALHLEERAACIVCGDTTPTCKPAPEPMFAACKQAQVLPEECVYIGDAEHDIVAGNTANMTTLVALYGYLKIDDQPQNWGADGVIEAPGQLLPWLKSRL